MTATPVLSVSHRQAHLDWGIAEIVEELRKLRDASLVARQRVGKPLKLPSRKTMGEIVDALSTALFPNRLSARELASESIDNFVGHTLDEALDSLVEQVLYELQFVSGEAVGYGLRERARSVVGEFAKQLPHIRALLEIDLRAAYEGDTAAGSVDEVLVCSPGVTALIHHRLAHVLHQLGVPLVARIIGEIAHSATGIDIHPGAQIEESLFIDHGTGVVIGETALIGKRVRIDHGVTVGLKFGAPGRHGAGNIIMRQPIIEDDVTIHAGATVLGRITVGRGSIIGANVWLATSVPPGSNITQARTRSESLEDGSSI